MKIEISHNTAYAYDAPIGFALQQLRLTPTDNALQKVSRWSVEVTGGQIELEFDDQLGNRTLLVRGEPGANEIAIVAAGTVITNDQAGILGKDDEVMPLWFFQRDTPRTEAGQGIKELAYLLDDLSDPVAAMHGLSNRIIERVPYGGGKTDAETTAEQALSIGQGVCQDHAQIFISAVRSIGLPARYVSGYLMMNDRIDQEASHGWAEVYIADLGWVGFDVSNGYSPDGRYVRLAVGRDSQDAAPVSGIRRGNAAESMIVSLQVQQ